MTSGHHRGPERPRLSLLKNERRVKRRSSPACDERPLPALRLIDCRPNLYQALRRVRRRATPREAVERALGRFSAFLAAKLRR